MKRFFIAINEEKDPDGSITGKVTDYLSRNGAEYVVSIGNRGIAGTNSPISRTSDENKMHELYADGEPVPEGTECILVLGGDGTLIRAVSELYAYDVPFVGINLGHLGYLTEAEVTSVYEVLDHLLADEYSIESRMMLKGEIYREGACIYEQCSLNDIALSRYGKLQVLHFELYVDGTYLNTYTADGMIIATPTGSTAYNLSAGGPICLPEAELFVVTPVCAHTMNTRSLILPSGVTIELKALDRQTEQMTPIASFDGGYYMLKEGDIIRVRQARNRCRMIKLNHITFLEKLRDKMKSI